MGTCTAAVNSMYSPEDGSELGTRVLTTITMSTTYATGGDTINASSIGFGTIAALALSVQSAGTAAYVPAPVLASGQVTKIQVYVTGTATTAPLAEVAAGVDLHLVSFSGLAYGY